MPAAQQWQITKTLSKNELLLQISVQNWSYFIKLEVLKLFMYSDIRTLFSLTEY